MFGPFNPVPQPPPVFSLKRTRSISPASLHKKRPGISYAPSCYTALPPHVTRTLSSELMNTASASPSSSSGSGTSTPGGPGDWVQRTEGLQLATPPPGERWGWPQDQQQGGQAPEGRMDEDEGMGMHMDDEMDARMDTSEPPRPAVSHSHHSFTHQPHLHREHPSTLPPHHAPPLHNFLAGSPQAEAPMSRSSSSSSSSSMSLSHQYPSSAPQLQPSSTIEALPALTSTQRKTGGGWKVTFGYRADCQKCRDRTEGHYSHVVSDDGVFADR